LPPAHPLRYCQFQTLTSNKALYQSPLPQLTLYVLSVPDTTLHHHAVPICTPPAHHLPYCQFQTLPSTITLYQSALPQPTLYRTVSSRPYPPPSRCTNLHCPQPTLYRIVSSRHYPPSSRCTNLHSLSPLFTVQSVPDTTLHHHAVPICTPPAHSSQYCQFQTLPSTNTLYQSALPPAYSLPYCLFQTLPFTNTLYQSAPPQPTLYRTVSSTHSHRLHLLLLI